MMFSGFLHVRQKKEENCNFDIELLKAGDELLQALKSFELQLQFEITRQALLKDMEMYFK